MFSQTVEYILRVVVFLASQRASATTTQQISDATQVPVGYLAKIMQRLVKANIVSSQRGRNGGFLLHPRAYGLTLLDIIQQLEPIVRIQACPLANPEHKQNLCPLHARLDQAIAAVEQTLGESTIQNLLVQLQNCQVGAALLKPQNVPEGASAI
ncbi:MAG: Rrf2 family transcriptional regulator [Phycisphaerae bacterium]